jgi:hypothetical protein
MTAPEIAQEHKARSLMQAVLQARNWLRVGRARRDSSKLVVAPAGAEISKPAR